MNPVKIRVHLDTPHQSPTAVATYISRQPPLTDSLVQFHTLSASDCGIYKYSHSLDKGYHLTEKSQTVSFSFL